MNYMYTVVRECTVLRTYKEFIFKKYIPDLVENFHWYILHVFKQPWTYLVYIIFCK